MITLAYAGVDFSEWTLVGERQGAQGAEAAKVSGFIASPDTTVEARPARTGHVVSGFTVPPMTGTLDLTVSSQLVDGETRELDDIFDALALAWSPLVDGELTWVSDRGVLMRTRARLASGGFPMPDRSPTERAPGQPVRRVPLSLSVQCLDGLWIGPQSAPYTGAVQVLNAGDLDDYPRIEWVGSGATVSGPGIPEFTLPTTAVPAVWDTDPATGGMVTIDGQPATALRQQMRGRVAPVPIEPGTTAPWTFTGCTAVVQPVFLNPWGR